MVQLVQPCLAKDIQRHFSCKYSLELRVSGSHANLELCIPGVPWVEVRFVTLESRPAKLRLAWVNWVNLCELSAVHVYIFLHVVTAMNLWQLMIRQPCTTRLE